MSSNTVNQRVNFASTKNPLEYPDFLEVQLKSFQDFLQLDTPPEKRKNEGLYKVFAENFPASFLEESFWLRGGTSDKLSDTYRIVESLSAIGFFPSVGSHPSVSHCHSGKFFISEVCFQTKVISLRSLYDSEE